MANDDFIEGGKGRPHTINDARHVLGPQSLKEVVYGERFGEELSGSFWFCEYCELQAFVRGKGIRSIENLNSSAMARGCGATSTAGC